jgi:hypothetical protein
MFRLLRLNPPNGWRAVAWELVIVTIGVLFALGVQQWAEERSWTAKARNAIAPIRTELGDHYAYAVEWRVVQPCIIAQIDRLQQRLTSSGATLDPAPVFREPSLGSYVLRIPSKPFIDTAWHETVGDGVSVHLDPKLRKGLGDHYIQAAVLVEITKLNGRDNQRLFTLSRPMALDTGTRLNLVQALDELRGRTEQMDFNSGQLIGQVARLGMKPDASKLAYVLDRSGTSQFCLREGLPLRCLADASAPIDYVYSPKNEPVATRPHLPSSNRR